MVLKTGEADNWVVADSEDEDSFDLGEPRIDPKMPQTVSPIETPLSPKTAKVAVATHSTISSFTNPPPKPTENSAISAYTPDGQPSNPPKARPRPRPRPIFKGSKSDSTAPTSDLVLHTPSSERMPPPTVIVNHNSIPPTIPDDMPGATNYSLDIAERAKMRSRNAKKPVLVHEDVIELTSDEDRPAPPPKPKTKPKPRPVKRTKVDHPNPADVSIAESEPTTIPVASSSFPLPPSDLSPSPDKRVDVLAGLNSPAKNGAVQKKGASGPVESHDVPTEVDRDTAAGQPPPFFAPSEEEQDLMHIDDDLPPVTVEKGKKADKKSAKKAVEEGLAKGKTKAKTGKVIKKKPQVEVVIESPLKRGAETKAVERELHATVDLPKVGSSTVASKKKPTSKKRRRVDDDESELSAVDNSEEDELQFLPPPSKTKGKKQAARKGAQGGSANSKGKGKGKVPAVEHEEPKTTGQKRGRAGRGVVLSDDEEVVADVQMPSSRSRSDKVTDKGDKGGPADADESALAPKEDAPAKATGKGKDKAEGLETPARSKENVSPKSSGESRSAEAGASASTKETPSSSSVRGYTFSRPSKSTPMSELIRRASSHPNSPFQASPRASYHSPLAKTSKSALRKIAPLHPNRRSPPPPLPPPPPPKKSKRVLQMEERWEEELEESVEGWFALSEAERNEWRRAKRDKELGVDD